MAFEVFPKSKKTKTKSLGNATASSFVVFPKTYAKAAPSAKPTPVATLGKASKGIQKNGNKIVGENLFLTNVLPIKQNDNAAKKLGKAAVNAAVSMPASIGELYRHVISIPQNLLDGKSIWDMPKDTSFVENILPTSVSTPINTLSQNHSILGNLAKMGIETVVDPATYITGGTAKQMLTPQQLGLGKLAKVNPEAKIEVPEIVVPRTVKKYDTDFLESGLAENVELGKPINIKEIASLKQMANEAVAKADPQTPNGFMTSEMKLDNAINQLETLNPITKISASNKAIDIPEGKVERGFSENTRTDLNNPDALRDSYTENPLSYEQLGNKETLAKAQGIFEQGYESARTQLSDLASRMQPEAIPLAKLLSRQATEAGNITGAREIISEVAERLTQAGQFGQAARILREADPETFLLTINKQLKSLNKEGLETYGKNWSDVDLTPDELEAISKIKRGDQQSYEAVFEQIQTRIADELPATAMEKVNAWRHIAMLLNPKTQVRNVGGNAIMMGMRQGSAKVSAVLQKVLIKPEQRTQVFKVSDDYKQVAAEYFEANKKDLLAGGNKYNEGIKLGMADKRVFRNNALESTRNFTYKLLEMGDTPFYRNAYINRLASYAQAKGIKNFDDLPQSALDTAKMEAEQATYKDASGLATFLNKAKHPDANSSLLREGIGWGVEVALPFTKTPINIIKRGIQYSPAGVINGINMWRTQKLAAAGIDEMAKGLTGTAIMGLGYLLAKSDILTGKAAKDPDLRAYNANTENSPFSILGKFT